MRVHIASTGAYLPPEVETADALASKVGRSAEWIVSRTGVRERHVAHEPMERMAAEAARRALDGGPPPDLLINVSTTPRQLIPDSSVFVARELGLDGIPCHSVHATCLGALAALRDAAALISAGLHRRVLVVAAEIASTSRRMDEPESACVLGDGAAAFVVEATPGGAPSRLVAFRMRTFPAGAELAAFEGAGVEHHPNDPTTTRAHNTFHMDGPRIYRFAVPRVGAVLDEVFAEAGWARADVRHVVPHQASAPALRALAGLGFSTESIVDIVGDHANCIAASLPMALDHLARSGRLSRGDRMLLVGTGAGVSVAAALLEW
jgi:3-oxoacyl-[acyl-carrier-protein] synthase-3